mmetsp:Transcript_76997/g.205762  ORF Transcript_76997/g.205762 Transcript_76997/m.205762 type:complete len:162 (-) Transcript_76997:125-610(-)
MSVPRPGSDDDSEDSSDPEVDGVYNSAKGGDPWATNMASYGTAEQEAFAGSEKDQVSAKLWHAAKSGALDDCQASLAEGADVNWKHGGKKNNTPLHVATEESHREVVKLLVQHKADVNASNAFGFTPMTLASPDDDKEIFDLLNQVTRLNLTRREALQKTQ